MREATSLQNAAALLTQAVDVSDPDELRRLIEEMLRERPAIDLIEALVELARALAFTTARFTHTLDDDLSDLDAVALTDEAVRPAAMEVAKAYARRIDRHTDETTR